MRINDKLTILEVFLFGATMGAGLGAILGLFLAPKRGADLRDEIKTGIGTLVDSARSLVNPSAGHSSVTLQDQAQVQRDENTLLPYAGSIM